MTEDVFYTKQEVAKRYKVTPRCIDLWEKSRHGIFPVKKIRHRKPWLVQGLDQWERGFIEGNSASGAADDHSSQAGLACPI
jgi:hypothetical protein